MLAPSPDPLTARKDELEAGLDALEARSSGAPPPAPVAAAPVAPPAPYTPPAVNIPASPVGEPTDPDPLRLLPQAVSAEPSSAETAGFFNLPPTSFDPGVPNPTAPPVTWDQIKASPSFQKATPEEQKTALGAYAKHTREYMLGLPGLDARKVDDHTNAFYETESAPIEERHIKALIGDTNSGGFLDKFAHTIAKSATDAETGILRVIKSLSNETGPEATSRVAGEIKNLQSDAASTEPNPGENTEDWNERKTRAVEILPARIAEHDALATDTHPDYSPQGDAKTLNGRAIIQRVIDALDKNKAKLDTYYKINPAVKQSFTNSLAGASATVFDVVTGGKVMITKMALSTYNEAHEHAMAENGGDEAKATTAAQIATAKIAPVLLAYAGAGKIAKFGADMILPKSAGIFTRGAVGAATSATANLATSTAARGFQLGNTQENLTDILFGLHGGAMELGGGHKPVVDKIKDSLDQHLADHTNAAVLEDAGLHEAAKVQRQEADGDLHDFILETKDDVLKKHAENEAAIAKLAEVPTTESVATGSKLVEETPLPEGEPSLVSTDPLVDGKVISEPTTPKEVKPNEQTSKDGQANDQAEAATESEAPARQDRDLLTESGGGKSEPATPKVGEVTKLMGADATLAEHQSSDQNVRYEIYNTGKQEGVVRVVDGDTGNVVSLTKYDKFDKAAEAYSDALKGEGLEPGPQVKTSEKGAGDSEEIAKGGLTSDTVNGLAHSTPKDFHKAIKLPKGATAIRVTDAEGRKIVLKKADLAGANPLHEAGPWAKVEAGTIGKNKKFVASKEEVGLRSLLEENEDHAADDAVEGLMSDELPSAAKRNRSPVEEQEAGGDSPVAGKEEGDEPGDTSGTQGVSPVSHSSSWQKATNKGVADALTAKGITPSEVGWTEDAAAKVAATINKVHSLFPRNPESYREAARNRVQAELLENVEQTGNPLRRIKENGEEAVYNPYLAAKSAISNAHEKIGAHETASLDAVDEEGNTLMPERGDASETPDKETARHESDKIKSAFHALRDSLWGKFSADKNNHLEGANTAEVLQAAKILMDERLGIAQRKAAAPARERAGIESFNDATGATKAVVKRLTKNLDFQELVEEQIDNKLAEFADDHRGDVLFSKEIHVGIADAIEKHAFEKATAQLTAGVPLKHVVAAMPEAIRAKVATVTERFALDQGINSALARIAEGKTATPEDQLMRTLAKALSEQGENKPIRVDPTLETRRNAAAEFIPSTGDISISPFLSDRGTAKGIIHEKTHALLYNKVAAYLRGDHTQLSGADIGTLNEAMALRNTLLAHADVPESVREAARAENRGDKQSLFDAALQTDATAKRFYGLLDPHELFTALLGDKRFQEFANSVRVDGTPASAKSASPTIWARVKQLMRSLVLGGKPVAEGSALARGFDLTVDLLASGDAKESNLGARDSLRSPTGPQEHVDGLLANAVRPDSKTASEEGYAYHATNEDNVRDIVESGTLDVHEPSHGTDQDTWPDGSTNPRSYFISKANNAHSFAPAEGKSVILRVKSGDAKFGTESTGDLFSEAGIPASKVEMLTSEGWKPLVPDEGLRAQRDSFDAEKYNDQRKNRFLTHFAAQHGFESADALAVSDPHLYNAAADLHSGTREGDLIGLRMAAEDREVQTDTEKRAEGLFAKVDALGGKTPAAEVMHSAMEAGATTPEQFARAFEQAGLTPEAAKAIGAAVETHFKLAGMEKAEQAAKEITADSAARVEAASQPVPADANGEPNLTSIKNERVDRERAERDLPPAIQSASKEFGETWQEALGLIERDSTYQSTLVDELNKKARPVTDIENATLLHRQIGLQADYDRAITDVNAAHETGDATAIGEAKGRFARISDELLDLYNINKSVGTETARGLVTRKMMAREDYTLAKLETRARAMKGGEELNEAQRAELKNLAQKVFDLQQEKIGRDAKVDSEAATEQADASVEQIKKKVAKKPTGERDLDAERLAITKGMQERIKKDGDISGLQSLIQKLAEHFVRTGVTERVPLIDAVHGVVKTIVPEMTSRQTMDAISGYGDFKQLNQDAIKAQLRDLKGQMQQVGKLEDMQAGNAPAKTGVERRVPGDIERRLIQEVNEMKKKGGFTVTDPATQLKSALDAVKTRLKNQIKDLSNRIFTGEKPVKKEGVPYDDEANTLKELRDRVQETLTAIEGKPEMTDAKRLEIATAATKRGIAEYDRRLREDDFSLKTTKKAPVTPELETLRAQREALREEYKWLEAAAHPERAAEAALAGFKTRSLAKIAELEQKIATEDFAAKPKREKTYVLDREGEKIEADLERAKERADLALQKYNLDRRTPAEKVLDFTAKWGRATKLTAITTLGKLTVAAAHRGVSIPLEDVAGAGLRHLPFVKEAFAQAPTEGVGPNVKQYAKSMTAGLTLGMRDAWKTLQTGKSDINAKFGKRGQLPHDWIEFAGTMHGAMKAPIRRATFTLSLERRIAHAEKMGIDTTDPGIQTRLMLESFKATAYLDSGRAIFMQDNRVADIARNIFSALERPNAQGKVPMLGKAGATAGRLLLPIVKVPTNYVAEAFTNAFGLVSGGVKLRQAFKAGIENLHPDEADVIARHLKKGSIGAAALALGFFNPVPGVIQAGGYYNHGEKRKEGDLKAGELRIFGAHIPSFASHSPLLEVLQLGATVRRAADAYTKKPGNTALGAVAPAAFAGAFGLAEETPFLNAMLQLETLRSDPSKYLGELAKGIIVPGGVQNFAGWFDHNEKGDLVKRDPKNFLERIETGIPGLRNKIKKKQKQD